MRNSCLLSDAPGYMFFGTGMAKVPTFIRSFIQLVFFKHLLRARFGETEAKNIKSWPSGIWRVNRDRRITFLKKKKTKKILSMLECDECYGENQGREVEF